MLDKHFRGRHFEIGFLLFTHKIGFDTSCKLSSTETHEVSKKVREKSRECHNHKPQPIPDTKRKRKQTKTNKRKSNKRMKSTKISSLFPNLEQIRKNSLRKHAYSYIFKISPSKNESFEVKIPIFFIFLLKT